MHEFVTSTEGSQPPEGLSLALRALWWCAKGEWEVAHGIAQDDTSRDGSWVHAHLHRVEGDLGNAAYWYARARRPVCHDDPGTERRAMVEALLP